MKIKTLFAFLFMVFFTGNLVAQSPSTEKIKPTNNTIVTDYATINNLIVAERMYRVSHRDDKH